MQKRLLAAFVRLLGVVAAGMTNFLPTSGGTLRYEVTMDGARAESDTGKMLVGERTLSGKYVQTVRMHLLRGSGCPEVNPDPKVPPKAIVNQRFVDRFSNGAPVLGRHIRFGDEPWTMAAEIVGVIANTKEDSLGAAPVSLRLHVLARQLVARPRLRGQKRGRSATGARSDPADRA